MRRFGMIASLLVLTALWAVAQSQLTVGVDLSTTGPAASLGIPQKNAILLGPSEIDGLKVHYIFLDDGSDTTLAVQNVKRLISEDNVDVMLGPGITPTAMAAIDTVAAAKVPMFAFGSTSQITSPMDAKKQWVFKTIADDDAFAAAMAHHMVSKGVKTIAIIAVNDPFGESWIAATEKAAAQQGIKVISVERFERTDNSATPQALRLIQKKPDAILIAATGTPSVTPQRSLVQLGYKGKIYQSSGAANPDFLRLGGKTVEGCYVVQNPFLVAEQLPDGFPTKIGAMNFLKLYESKYGARSSFPAAPWDALKLLQAAVPVALKSGARPGTPQFREALRSALEHLRGVVGVAGVYNLSATNHVGISETTMVVMRVENDKWKLDETAADLIANENKMQTNGH